MIEARADTAPIVEMERRFSAAMKDMRAPLADAGRVAAERILKTFAAEGSPQWQALSALTLARKQGSAILVEGGGLLSSLTVPAMSGGAGAPGAIYNLASHSLEMGTRIAYAAIHQFGGVVRAKTARALMIPMPGGGVVFRRQVRIPARPFMPQFFGLDDTAAIGSAFARWIDHTVLAGLGRAV